MSLPNYSELALLLEGQSQHEIDAGMRANSLVIEGLAVAARALRSKEGLWTEVRGSILELL